MKAIVHWFADNSVAANLLMLGIIALGILTLPKLKQEVVPTIEAEVVTISVPYPGASPEEIERSICARIEENVQGITGVDEVTSSAAEGSGTVVVKLLLGADRQKALDDVQGIVDRIDTFPEDAEEPQITLVEINSSAMKVMVWGEADARTLREVATDLQAELSSLDDISRVELKNAPPFEISIEVSADDLARYGLTFDALTAALRTSSLDLPSGSVRTAGGEVLLRGKAQAYSGEEFAALPLRQLPDGTDLLIGDVATVRDDFAETDQSMRFNGQPAVMVEIYRVGDQNALAIGPAAEAFLDEYRAELPAGVNLSVTGDETVMLRERRDLMVKNGLQGLLLVMITLALFLRFRLALWVTVGIPLSFLGAISLMPYQDVSVNMISLFAFIIVLGIVVDDAIVVAENIHHHRQKNGKHGTGLEAASRGAYEMSKPVIFAVLTTMVAFLPMLFMPGSMGTFARNIPLIVIGVLLFSIVESLFILPAHLKHLPAVEKSGGKGLFTLIQDGIDSLLNFWIERIYAPSVRVAIGWRYATLVAGGVLFVLTLQLPGQGFLKFNFFPQIESDDVSVQLTMPQGTPAATTEAILHDIELAAAELGQELEDEEGRPLFQSVLASMGGQPYREKNSAMGGQMAGSFSGAHLGEVNLELISAEDREISSKEIGRRWEAKIGKVAGAESVIFSADLMRGEGDVTLRIAGDDLDELREVADAARLDLGDRAGVTAVRDSFSAGTRELILGLTPEGRAAGLSYLDLVRQVRQGFYGEEVQSVQRGRDEVKVFVRYTEAERKTLQTLEDLRIYLPDGSDLPFSHVATVDSGVGYSTISRADRQRTVDVLVDVDTKVVTAGELEATITEELLPEILAGHPSVSASFAGAGKDRKDFMMTMASNGVAALLGMFILLAIPLRSYSRSLVIMGAIPFGLIGAFWGHLLLGFDLSMFSIIGIMALTGVVVNDSLVLIDYATTLRTEGLGAFEAILQASKRRFRAILLTTLTTFAGLTPLLLEKSLQARFMIPMAISLAFGVLFATVITLVLLPALYMVAEDLLAIPRKLRVALFGRPPESEETTPPEPAA
ncbi:MAG: efflux RND transporter permease subunit [Planctomycetota bacterium]|nr:efflux RND transporter permease subunit [Planctomycetota bacterium]